MPHSSIAGVGSDARVGLDHASLRGQPAGGDTRYAVAVHGPTDEAWADAYLAVQRDSVPHRRFRLDRKTRTVAFSCPTVEGPAFVFEMLERLEELLELACRRAAADGAALTPPRAPLRPLV